MSEQQREALGAKEGAILRVYQRAEEALGDRQKAQRWMTKANRALGGVAPASLLDSPDGIEQVLAVLLRIENGTVG